MHRAIAINALCFGDAPLAVVAEAAARLGARAIVPTIEQASAPDAARRLADAGVRAAAITHRAFGFATTDAARRARDRLDRTIDAAAALGAGTIVMTTGGRGALAWRDAAARFADAVAPCATHARAAGVRLAIEPTSHLYADVSIAHRLADTVALAHGAGIAVTIDLFACWTDADVETAIAAAGPAAALVQVSDQAAGARALPCRVVPGDGIVPVDRLLPLIVAAGYRGWFDLELIGPRIVAEGPEIALARAGAAVGAMLVAAGLAAD